MTQPLPNSPSPIITNTEIESIRELTALTSSSKTFSTKTFKVSPLQNSQDVINKLLEAYREANPFRYREPQKYQQILNDFYFEEIKRRTALACAVGNDRSLIGEILEFCSVREHIIDFMCDWCWTFDPRNASLGLPTTLPWIPWPKQIEFIEWMYTRYLNRESGLVEKARDAGATYLFCLIFLREWRWVDGFSAGIGSNKLENVDKRDNPKAVFPKIRTILENLPPWWLPTGFDRKRHDNVANLINPENHANISGEGGDDIGRGDRRSMYFVDEAAYLEHPDQAAAALSRTTDTCFYLSTPHGMNWFGKKRHSGTINVFSFHWKADPRLNEEWFERYSANNDPVIVFQEVLMDYHASVEGICIPIKWIEAAVDLKLNISHTDPRIAGVDIAIGGKNKSSYVLRHGPQLMKITRWGFDNTTEVAHRAINEGEEDMIQAMGYDSIGVGAGMSAVLRTKDCPPRFRYYALSGNDAVSDSYYDEYQKFAKDLFLNARAERWYRLRKRFEKAYKFKTTGEVYPISELISIPNDRQLISQLASPLLMTTESGKMKVESKEHMRGRGVDSPDDADATVYAYSVDAKTLGDFLLYGFDYVPRYDKYGVREKFKECFTRFKIDWAVINGDEKRRQCNYGSTYFDKNYNAYHISAYWNPYRKKLYVYDAMTFDNRPPEFVAAKIKISMENCVRQRHYYMEENADRGVGENLAKLYKRSGISFQVNTKYDETASVYAANQMFLRRQIIVHESLGDCKKQFSLWTKEMGKAKRSGFGLCFALCNIVSLLRESRQLEEVQEIVGYSPNPPGLKDHFLNETNPMKPAETTKPVGMADYFG